MCVYIICGSDVTATSLVCTARRMINIMQSRMYNVCISWCIRQFQQMQTELCLHLARTVRILLQKSFPARENRAVCISNRLVTARFHRTENDTNLGSKSPRAFGGRDAPSPPMHFAMQTQLGLHLLELSMIDVCADRCFASNLCLRQDANQSHQVWRMFFFFLDGFVTLAHFLSK